MTSALQPHTSHLLGGPPNPATLLALKTTSSTPSPAPRRRTIPAPNYSSNSEWRTAASSPPCRPSASDSRCRRPPARRTCAQSLWPPTPGRCTARPRTPPPRAGRSTRWRRWTWRPRSPGGGYALRFWRRDRSRCGQRIRPRRCLSASRTSRGRSVASRLFDIVRNGRL